MFLLEWQGKSVNNGSQYFKKLGNSVEALSLVDELEEDIVDGTSDE